MSIKFRFVDSSKGTVATPERDNIQFNVDRNIIPQLGLKLGDEEISFYVEVPESVAKQYFGSIDGMKNQSINLKVSNNGNIPDLGWYANFKLANIIFTNADLDSSVGGFKKLIYHGTLGLEVYRKATSLSFEIYLEKVGEAMGIDGPIETFTRLPGSGTIAVNVGTPSSPTGGSAGNSGSSTFDLLNTKAILPRTQTGNVILTINTETSFFQTLPIIRATGSSVLKITNLSLSLFMVAPYQIHILIDGDVVQKLLPAGILWSPPLAAGATNAISSPITKPQATSKFNIFTRNDPIYLVSGQTISITAEGGDPFNTPRIPVTYLCSYEEIQF